MTVDIRPGSSAIVKIRNIIITCKELIGNMCRYNSVETTSDTLIQPVS